MMIASVDAKDVLMLARFGTVGADATEWTITDVAIAGVSGIHVRLLSG